MDKVIIVGTYHFLGFSLCEKLLEEGIEVCGFRFDDKNTEEFLEEKKLSIGRNANFEEISGIDEENSLDLFSNLKQIIVVSFYDLFFNTEIDPNVMLTKLSSHILNTKNEYSNLKLLCLYPINYLYDFPAKLKESIALLKKKGISVQSIYLPTVFGPWQSSTFLFQQYLLKDYQKNEPKLDEREYTEDAVFISDVLGEIIQLMHSHDYVDVLIQSSKGKQWIKGAKHLKWKGTVFHQESIEPKLLEENIKLINLKENISIEDGIEKQKKHLTRLL